MASETGNEDFFAFLRRQHEEIKNLLDAVERTSGDERRHAFTDLRRLLAVLAVLAERTAPTRPHPGVELAGQNALVGPFAAMLDRARDALSGTT